VLGISSPFVLADNATYKGSVTVVNEAPMNGTCVTPIWIGIHDGTFDTYNGDEPIPEPFEALAEDGNNVPVKEAFAAANGTIWDGVVGQEPLCPGDNATLEFEFEAGKGTAYYFSYAAMILPSNDAWVSNGDPVAYPVIDETTAEFLPVTIDVAGSGVLDAGTEVNDELPANTAFFGQETPNTGEDENGVVIDHLGFNPAGSGGILDSFPGADFTQEGYKVMIIKVAGEMVMGNEEENTTSGSFVAGLHSAIVIFFISLSLLV
jgi:hypothetical protein